MAILLAKAADSNVPDSPGKWRAGEIVGVFDDAHVFGGAEVPAAGKFYHITVTDKTQAEAEEYMQQWRHEPTTVQISATGNDRLLEVTSSMVAAGGGNAFTAAQVDQFCTDLNTEYPTANASRDSLTNSSFRFNVTVPLAARDELIERIEGFVRDVQYRRRRWYVTAAGRAFLAGNGGEVSGPAATVATYLRDGLLD